jgi:hypothetical protein
LPPPSIERWTARRKAAVVVAIAAGLITVAAACERWALTVEELEAWQRGFAADGVAALRATRRCRIRQSEMLAERGAVTRERRR